MTDRARHDPPVTPAGTSFASAALLRPITIDELSTVRHLHLMSARRLSASHLSEAELQAFCDHINSDPYTVRLIDQVRQGRLIAATLMDEIVATAGWIPANDSGATARMMAIFVAPLYALHGLGRLVVEAAEAQAAYAGFRVFTHRAPIGAVGFFTRLGYDTASHGVWMLPNDQPMPVGFMRKVAGNLPPPKR